jgi:hypothetical protein
MEAGGARFSTTRAYRLVRQAATRGSRAEIELESELRRQLRPFQRELPGTTLGTTQINEIARDRSSLGI